VIITPTSLTINQLLGSANEQYLIPTYQRRYSWHERQVGELIDDIRLIEGGDTHLLGSIVCLTGHHTAGLNRLELVDGQQRLTTLSILLECIRQRLESLEEVDAAQEISRLLTAKPLGGKPARKVLLDSIDAADFERLIGKSSDDICDNKQLCMAFQIVREWVSAQPLEELSKFLYRLVNQSIVIRLDVSEAKDAFKLFETINNRGLKLSPTDIIKNFLLGNAARFGHDQLQLARSSWSALIGHLDGTNPDAFFRYYLMAQAHYRVTASEVVACFKELFMEQVLEAKDLPERHLYIDNEEDEEEEGTEPGEENSTLFLNEVGTFSFQDFLSRLVVCAQVYGELILVKTGKPKIDRHLRNLRMIKAVQTYGLLMHLRTGGCSDKDFIQTLRLTENFILRRHICRERANETEALFARLCAVNPVDPISAIKEAYRPLCPSDEKFSQEFEEASFKGPLVDRARYCLERFETTKHGEHDELQVLGSDDVHVEHIIPLKIKTRRAIEEFGDWPSYLGEKADALHARYVWRIGNLTIFAGPLNIAASNNPFAKKKVAYKQSAIKLTQDVAAMPQFKFKQLQQRSHELAELAIKLWPQP